MDRITIVGMGPLGTAIGMGLKAAELRNTEVIATGRDRRSVSNAEKLGAVDGTTRSLGSAVERAQLIIIDAGPGETRDVLEALGKNLREDTVITDTGNLKVPILEWADSYLPKGVSFVAGRPMPNKSLVSQEDAEESAFEGGHYCIIPAKSATNEAGSTVVGLAEILGARPFFLQPEEHDTYAAAMTVMPHVLAAALVTSTSSSESWREMSRLASTEYREASKLASTDPEAAHALARSNPEPLIHWLDQMILELYAYRNKLKEDSDELLEDFIGAWEARARWEHGVVEEYKGPEIPTAGQAVAHMFLGSRLLRRQRQMDQRARERDWKYARRKS